MTAWYSPLVRALDALERPIEFFVRDDDAGWSDARLVRLLELFEARQMPIDLAVIPGVVSGTLGRTLLKRIEQRSLLGLHQHGWTHENHEPTGRSCEFGPSRPDGDVAADIEAGQRVLRELFGPALDPIFTPPWNRCSNATASLLPQRGIAALSRDLTAGRVSVTGLAEIPVHVDWFARRRGVRLSAGEWAEAFARAIGQSDTPVGLMLHHAPMDDPEFDALETILDVMAGHPRVRPALMRELVDAANGKKGTRCLN